MKSKVNIDFEGNKALNLVIDPQSGYPINPALYQVFYSTRYGIPLIWNGLTWQGLEVDVEKYISVGEQMNFLTSTASGGSSSLTSPNYSIQADLNDVSGAASLRSGEIILAITTTTNSRINHGYTSSLNQAVLRLDPHSFFYIGWDISITNNLGQGVIDYANDPVLIAHGLFDSFSGSFPNYGVFIRPPRLGEPAFLHYGMYMLGTPITSPTNIPYTNTSLGYYKVGYIWNGSLDTLTYIASSGNGINFVLPLGNFLALNPLLTAGMIPCLYLARQGNPIIGIARSYKVDNYYRHIRENFKKHI